MTFNTFFQPLSFLTISILISLILFISPIDGHANNSPSPSPSPFDSKAYLKRYGYLEYARANIVLNGDESDEARIIESAIKTFQENFHIKPTGDLDFETLTTMNTPRCGVPDFINGSNYMQARSSSKFATFPGSPKWHKNNLIYALSNGFPAAAKFPLELAFTEWQSNSEFMFSENQDGSDMVLGFYRGDHGDGAPFDRSGNILGHSWPPAEQGSAAHFNADVKWSYDNTRGTPKDAVDFESVALHEIGHMLGLAHSSVESAVMYPYTDYGVTKTLDDDDIKGIRSLYPN